MCKFGAGLAACGGELQQWQVSALQKFWAGHSKLVDLHHGHEDDMFTPMLKEKVNYPAKLEADHDALVALAKAVTLEVGALEGGGSLTAVTSVFETYHATMKAHLKEEEELCVPLIRAFFDPKYVGAKVQEIMQAMDPIALGAFVHYQGSKAELGPFLKQEGIPFFVWYIQFKGARAQYRAQMETQIQALLTKTPPTKPLTAKKDLTDAMNCGAYQWRAYQWRVTA